MKLKTFHKNTSDRTILAGDFNTAFAGIDRNNKTIYIDNIAVRELYKTIYDRNISIYGDYEILVFLFSPQNKFY
jgi:hypothetical protein